MKTFDAILKWVGFIYELLNDGRDKYEKHFQSRKEVETITEVKEVQTTELTQEHE